MSMLKAFKSLFTKDTAGAAAAEDADDKGRGAAAQAEEDGVDFEVDVTFSGHRRHRSFS